MTRRKHAILGALSALLPILAACGGGGDGGIDVAGGTVLRNATVVNTRDGSLAAGMNVHVEGGKIRRVTTQPLHATGGAQAIDASGKYIVPGYLDMHAHAVDSADRDPPYWPLMIASGITGFREESDSPANVERGKVLNQDSAAGRVLAPEAIFHGGEAHLNPAISARDASNAGAPSFDHLGAGWGLLMDCSSEEQTLRAAALAGSLKPPFPPTFVTNPRAYDGAQNAPYYQRILDTYDEAKCIELSKVFAKNGTWQTLTLIRLRTQVYGNDPQYRDDPDLAYIAKSTRAIWQQVGDQFDKLPASAVTTLRQFYELQKRVSRLMKQNGVKMMTGSDFSGDMSIWLVPGISLHQEFRELASAGFSPLEVLQMATRDPAEFLGRQSSLGSVEEGKDADLVVLDANPVADVANLDRIRAVVLKGRYLSSAALDKMKADAAAAIARQ